MRGFIRSIILIFVVLITGYLLAISPGLNFIKDSNGDLSNVYKKFARNSCNEPLEYKLGDIDERFGLSEEEIIKLSKESEDIWEKAVNKDLFVYNPDSDKAVVINFIFDDRQSQVLLSKSSEQNLEEKWKSYEDLANIYETISGSYDTALNEYNNNVDVYESRLSDFNERVDKWNDNPGTEKQFQELKNTESQIKKLYSILESERTSLNYNADKLEELGNQLDDIFNQLDKETDLHNKQFAGEEVIDAGDYGQYEINIYQFYSKPDLKLTLAHEMGHALGLDHLENSKSIMYFLLNDQDLLDLKLSQEDIDAILELCGE